MRIALPLLLLLLGGFHHLPAADPGPAAAQAEPSVGASAPARAEVPMPAPQLPDRDASPAPLTFDILQSKIFPEGGRTVEIHRVRPPVLPAPPVVVPLTEERRAELRRLHPRAFMTTRLLWLNATAYPGGQYYLEWQSPAGGSTFAAWSRADIRLFSALPEFDVAGTNTRWLLLVSVRPSVRPPAAPPLPLRVPPAIPADGPGFLLVKGDAANSLAMEPVTALHELYAKDKPQLVAKWEDRTRLRLAEAARPALPPPPPKDTVIHYWPKQSRRHGAGPAAAPPPDLHPP